MPQFDMNSQRRRSILTTRRPVLVLFPSRLTPGRVTTSTIILTSFVMKGPYTLWDYLTHAWYSLFILINALCKVAFIIQKVAMMDPSKIISTFMCAIHFWNDTWPIHDHYIFMRECFFTPFLDIFLYYHCGSDKAEIHKLHPCTSTWWTNAFTARLLKQILWINFRDAIRR